MWTEKFVDWTFWKKTFLDVGSSVELACEAQKSSLSYQRHALSLIKPLLCGWCRNSLCRGGVEGGLLCFEWMCCSYIFRLNLPFSRHNPLTEFSAGDANTTSINFNYLFVPFTEKKLKIFTNESMQFVILFVGLFSILFLSSLVLKAIKEKSIVAV